MNNEEKLAKEVEAYRQLASSDRNIDIAALTMQALQKRNSGNFLSAKQKRAGYLVSLLLPPVGLLFAVKFYFSNTDDGKDAAMACIALTAVSILSTIIIFKTMFAGSGTSLEQIQQINPNDIKSLIE